MSEPHDTNLSATFTSYDGWRVVQERDVDNTPTVSYTRGTDLSGTLQGAGGIGGLLARSHGYSGGNWSTHNFYHADGNGNVTYIVNASQTRSASYRYDPYGNALSASELSGLGGIPNTYRFSSKMLDPVTSCYYYGYRWYTPNLQRWLNRDPIQEWGGLNLYGFVGNTPIAWIDLLGLSIADVQHIEEAAQQSIDGMTERCERSDGFTGSGWFGGGWINNGMSWFTCRKGCKDQSIQTRGDLVQDARTHKYDDYWSFDVSSQWFPYPHAWIEATSTNPKDPKIRIDPWKNRISNQWPSSYPPPYSGGPVNTPPVINVNL